MRILRLSLFALASLACAAHVALAQSPWQTERLRCVRKGSFPVDNWEIAELHLERSTLNDVEKSVGPTQRFRIGRDAVSAEALCYRLEGNQVVVFESGPLGGTRNLLLAIAVLERRDLSLDAQCAQPQRDLKKEISGARAIGSARADVERTVGAEYCYRDSATTEWNFEQVRDDWGTLSGLHALFEQDKLRWWRAYSVTSR